MVFNNRIIVFTLSFVVSFLRDGVNGDCPRDVDPCSSNVYTELNEPTRSTRYNVTDVNEDDYTITEAWYRSTSGAGGDMPTEPVYMEQCNAYAPIYLTESLPSEEDGITDVAACASYLDDDCVRSYTVPVKNCGAFNVYCLSPVYDSWDRYCMGSELECEYGYTSDNGFTPGCEEIVGTTGNCPVNVDPCLSSVYVELNEPTRSIVYNASTDYENDYTLTEEWYRSVSGAGGDMPTDVTHTNQCNAYAPIYLTGSLPEESDGIVTMVGCASFLQDTCVRYYLIPVKNCGDYNVYCLPPVADSLDRYCMGSELECEDGYTSANGFTPSCVPIEETTESTSSAENSREISDEEQISESSTSSEENNRVGSGEKGGSLVLIILAVVAVMFGIAFIVAVVIVCMLKKNSKTTINAAGKADTHIWPPGDLFTTPNPMGTTSPPHNLQQPMSPSQQAWSPPPPYSLTDQNTQAK